MYTLYRFVGGVYFTSQEGDHAFQFLGAGVVRDGDCGGGGVGGRWFPAEQFQGFLQAGGPLQGSGGKGAAGGGGAVGEAEGGEFVAQVGVFPALAVP
ncbi:MAG: hypothetical protein JWL81_419 [Verrucomicrobiales bacterium]|nr:hypothetical protein [Verrucomicrobiales bacterium]